MIGRMLTDVLLEKNRTDALGCTVLAVGRSEEKAKARFSHCWGRPDFMFVCGDVGGAEPLQVEHADYIFHLASTTHPLDYMANPIGTVMANVWGTRNLLELAAELGTERVVFASSVEIYGENRGDTEMFSEDYCGYLDCNTLRAGYPESKRCGEALCQAYVRQKGVDVVISRLARTFGPTMLPHDSKAMAQFIKKAVAGEDIVLKSEGRQVFSYTYTADAVAGLLYCCLKGQCGQAYNVADGMGTALRDLAAAAADQAGTRVVFELPEETERSGYSTATKAVMDGRKLRALGWTPRWNVLAGMERTIRILKACGR